MKEYLNLLPYLSNDSCYNYIESISLHKYNKIDEDSFFSLFNFEFFKYCKKEFKNAEYFKCNEYLILKNDKEEHIFKYNANLDFLTVEKIDDNLYKLWVMSYSIEEDEPINYYADIVIKNNKLLLETEHLVNIISNDFDKYELEIYRQFEIYQDMLNDYSILEFDNLLKSYKSIEKYKL